MFIDRLEVYNNTMIKYTEHITHTQTTYSHIKLFILKCININLIKNPVIILTHLYCYYNKYLYVENVTPPGPYLTK